MVTGSEKEFPDPRDDEEEDVVDVAGDHQLQGRILKVIAVWLFLGWKKVNFVISSFIIYDNGT
jgi:hypothetical protein